MSARQVDGCQAVTLPFLLDVASVMLSRTSFQSLDVSEMLVYQVWQEHRVHRQMNVKILFIPRQSSEKEHCMLRASLQQRVHCGHS